MRELEAAEAWAATREPDELPGIVYALGIFEQAGWVTTQEAREWRRAILDRHGLPLRPGQA